MARVVVTCASKPSLQFATHPITFVHLLDEVQQAYSLQPDNFDLTYSDGETADLLVYSEASYQSALVLCPLTLSVAVSLSADLGDLGAPVASSYQGEKVNGVPHGQGSLVTSKGIRYDGAFFNGKPHGRGTMLWPSGMSYQGDWRAGKMHGQARYQLASGILYEGQMQNSRYHGQGTMTWPNGNR